MVPNWHLVMMLPAHPCLYLEVKQHFFIETSFCLRVEMLNRKAYKDSEDHNAIKPQR